MSDSLQPSSPVAHQAPLSMGFSRQDYWSGLPGPPPGDLADPGIEPSSLTSAALSGGFFATEQPPGKPALCVTMRQMRPCASAPSPSSGMCPHPQAALASGQSGQPASPPTHRHPSTRTLVNTGPLLLSQHWW